MVKKGNLKRSLEPRSLNVRVPQSSPMPAAVTVEAHPPLVEDLLEGSKQTFSSDEQALSFFIESIADKLGEAGDDRAQMSEFLNLLLESDPVLREEILSGVSAGK